MIKFYRKIRQRLLTENKLSKYLLYAIGEIVLVMIGILLALQINNWNQVRQNSQTNIKLLIKMDNELQLNIDRLSYLITSDIGYELRISRNDSLFSILKKGVITDDIDRVIKNFYVSNTPNLYTSTYEEMKNTGRLYTIGSDELLKAIETYYKLCEKESNYILNINDYVAKQLLADINDSWFKLQQDYYSIGPELAIKDNAWLFDQESKEYKGLFRLVGLANYNLRSVKNRLENLKGESEKLQKLIKNELKRRTKI